MNGPDCQNLDPTVGLNKPCVVASAGTAPLWCGPCVVYEVARLRGIEEAARAVEQNTVKWEAKAYAWQQAHDAVGDAMEEQGEVLDRLRLAAGSLIEWLMGAYGNPAWPQGEWNEYGVACRDAYYEAAKPQSSEGTAE